MKPNVLLSPPTINSFLINVNDSYKIIISNNLSVEEINLINRFILEFGDLKILKESDSFDDNKLLIIGIDEGFENTPNLKYLKDNDSVVIYNAEKDSLYIHYKDLEGLREVLNLLKTNSKGLEYFSIKINKGVVEELIVNNY